MTRRITTSLPRSRERGIRSETPTAGRTVFAELTFRHALPQIPMRRRHHAHVHAQRLSAADALELLFFQAGAPILACSSNEQVANLVEQQRAAVSDLETTELRLCSSGERALFMSEELRSREASPEWRHN